MRGWCPIHLHDWPTQLTSLPVLGALVNIEWNAKLVSKYYNWSGDWPDDFPKAVLHFMYIWRKLAHQKGIKLVPRAEVVFALEGLELLDDLNILPVMRDMGLCSIQLAHIGPNSYFDRFNGLTDKGKQLFKIMHELDLKLDLSHLHDALLYQIVQQFPGKRIVSHVVCESLLDWSLMRRSNTMNDEELRMCNADLYGVPFIDDLISPNATMNPDERKATVEIIAKHILHLVDIVGLNRVALGPDYFDYQLMKNLYGVEVFTIRNMDSISGLEMLENHLKQSGLSQNQVEHVFWRNAQNFINKHLRT